MSEGGTSEERLAALAGRSRRVSLAVEVGDSIHLVHPEGMNERDGDRCMSLYGPLSTTVLSSVRSVGVLVRDAEYDELAGQLNALIDGQEGTGSKSGPDLELAVYAWRLLSMFAHISEDLAALLDAIGNWVDAGRPRGFACAIGKTYLRWPEHRRNVREVLLENASQQRLAELLHYVDSDITPRHISADEAKGVFSVATRTLANVGGLLHIAATLMTDDVQRSFVRWRHRLTVTSPSVVPIWLPRQQADVQGDLRERFATGFGIVDWEPGKHTEPSLIVWPADRGMVATYGRIVPQLLQVMTFVLDATMRWGIESLPSVPYFLSPKSPPTESELAGIAALHESGYRNAALVEWFQKAHPGGG